MKPILISFCWDWANPAHRASASAAAKRAIFIGDTSSGLKSIRSAAGLQQFGEVALPPFGLPGRAVAARLLAGGNEDEAAVLHLLHLALHDAELGRVALVVRGVDGEDLGADL